MISIRESLEDPSIPYQSILLSFSAAVFAFEFYLRLRQIPHLRLEKPPASIAPYLIASNDPKSDQKETSESSKETSKELTAQETFERSQSYALDKIKFSLFTSIIDQIETWAILTNLVPIYMGMDPKKPSSGIALLWNLSETLTHKLDLILADRFRIGTGEIPISMVFVSLLSLMGMITSIPIDLLKTFGLEEKHGFNKQSFGLWVSDFIKTTILSALLGLPLVAVFIKVVRYAGEAFVQYVMLFVMALVLFMYVGYPYLIAPLFNKYQRLSEFPEYQEVQTRTENLAKRINFPLGRLWVIDGSKRSAHSNAFFFGLPGLTKHIVLYDTLLKQSTPAEVEAVLAHELGHWKMNHTVTLLGLSQFQIAFSLSIFRFFIWNSALFQAFGFSPLNSSDPFSTNKSIYPILIGFTLAQNLFTPLNSIMSFGSNSVSRRLEFQADHFAVRLGGSYANDLKWALVRISAENKATTSCDWLYSAFHHSHPTLPERLARLDDEVSDGKKKK
ncbi:CaaX prenyl protease [Melampsora larici-populina 98AG31]|uniref:Ste24 endopeptidase n=1 Tax=Melampsora larici-populina (strain 98AG31 / pathotype 3-4-7) TaxID=747676 RepID=F4RB30_MELLP|nr:CaaX prenyl protease [Melampsora larici-populina 98AG31]EGG10334.1 CaaX prenyl protease [Melampsora larici-populina 98AG31]